MTKERLDKLQLELDGEANKSQGFTKSTDVAQAGRVDITAEKSKTSGDRDRKNSAPPDEDSEWQMIEGPAGEDFVWVSEPKRKKSNRQAKESE